MEDLIKLFTSWMNGKTDDELDMVDCECDHCRESFAAFAHIEKPSIGKFLELEMRYWENA
jgi:hypothetical protein